MSASSTPVTISSPMRPPTAEPGPMFMVGSVRSGTTLLRNLLRSHPDLMCPEETHFYRWGEPFGTRTYRLHAVTSELLKQHRKLDGVKEEDFVQSYEGAMGRRDLMLAHVSLFAAAKGHPARRWFDKTPQNVYGLPLLLHDFPDAKFVHIIRNPLNVVASLLEGRVIAAPNAVAAANYWNEAAAIVNTLRPLMAGKLHELRYEDLTQHPGRELARIHSFLGLEAAAAPAAIHSVHGERNAHETQLTAADREKVSSICARWAGHYGYNLGAGA